MTYQDAIKAGYIAGETKYQRGYVSRKTNADMQPVHVAGGRRKGQLYALLPCYTSTQYCIRQYFIKGD